MSVYSVPPYPSVPNGSSHTIMRARTHTHVRGRVHEGTTSVFSAGTESSRDSYSSGHECRRRCDARTCVCNPCACDDCAERHAKTPDPTKSPWHRLYGAQGASRD
jgi:hypothetical protein